MISSISLSSSEKNPTGVFEQSSKWIDLPTELWLQILPYFSRMKEVSQFCFSSKKILYVFGKEKIIDLALQWEKDLIHFYFPLTNRDSRSFEKYWDRIVCQCSLLPWKEEKEIIKKEIERLSPSKAIQNIWEKRAIRWDIARSFKSGDIPKMFFGPQGSNIADRFVWAFENRLFDYANFLSKKLHRTEMTDNDIANFMLSYRLIDRTIIISYLKRPEDKIELCTLSMLYANVAIKDPLIGSVVYYKKQLKHLLLVKGSSREEGRQKLFAREFPSLEFLAFYEPSFFYGVCKKDGLTYVPENPNSFFFSLSQFLGPLDPSSKHSVVEMSKFLSVGSLDEIGHRMTSSFLPSFLIDCWLDRIGPFIFLIDCFKNLGDLFSKLKETITSGSIQNLDDSFDNEKKAFWYFYGLISFISLMLVPIIDRGFFYSSEQPKDHSFVAMCTKTLYRMIWVFSAVGSGCQTSRMVIEKSIFFAFFHVGCDSLLAPHFQSFFRYFHIFHTIVRFIFSLVRISYVQRKNRKIALEMKKIFGEVGIESHS